MFRLLETEGVLHLLYNISGMHVIYPWVLLDNRRWGLKCQDRLDVNICLYCIPAFFIFINIMRAVFGTEDAIPS